MKYSRVFVCMSWVVNKAGFQRTSEEGNVNIDGGK